MFTYQFAEPWAAWLAALAAPLHGRLAWRLPTIVLGILLANGRRTVTRWWLAAGITKRFRSYYYSLDSIGRKTHPVAAALLKIVRETIPSDGPLVFAIDDTPTKRSGPKVQGASVHHNPTPGPVGSKFLYGHCWVTLSRVAHHARRGVIGLPLLAQLYVRKKDVPSLPAKSGVSFATKLKIAAEMVRWLGDQLPSQSQPAWVVVDGGYAKAEFLKPAVRAGFVVVARLRKDAALCDLPPVLEPGQKRGRGRPPKYGKAHLSLAKRAGQKRGWKQVTARTTTGRSVVKSYKTFLATWRPAGGVVRVVLLKDRDQSWRAFLCTDEQATVEAIAQAVFDRWAIEQNYHDLKEIEGIEQVQLRRLWSNVGAMNLSLWVHALVEVWAWDRSEASLSDRRDRPWDDADRRPSHDDKRRAVQQEILSEEYRRLGVPDAWSEKIRQLLAGKVRRTA